MSKINILIILILVFLLSGCVSNNENITQNSTQSKINIIDSTKENISIPLPINKVVAFTSESAEVMRAIGSEDKIIGVSKYLKKDEKFWGELANKTVVGSVFSPNYEQIAALDPDIVITYSKWPKSIKEKLKPFNITVVRLDFYKSKEIKSEVRTLGKIMEKQEKAEELIEFYDKYDNLIKSRIDTVPKEKRVRVYIEGFTDYHSAGNNTGWGQQTEMAGGINIAKELTGDYPEVSDEWIIKQNPDIIIKVVSSSKNVFGYEVNNTQKAVLVRDQILNRTGWDSINAVKNKKVYLISGDLMSGPRYIIATLYLAKQFYPEKFKDIDTEKIYREYLERFQNLSYQGTWEYP